MLNSRRLRRLLCAVLAFGLAGAPLAPASASASLTPAAAATHVHHASGSDLMSTDSTLADHTGCAQHDQCQGSCCSACAHCAGAVAPWQTAFLSLHAGHDVLVAGLFPDPPIAVLPRPPKSLR